MLSCRRVNPSIRKVSRGVVSAQTGSQAAHTLIPKCLQIPLNKSLIGAHSLSPLADTPRATVSQANHQLPKFQSLSTSKPGIKDPNNTHYYTGDIRYNLDRNFIRHWGFHIYRCTYKDDEKWSLFLNRIDEDIRHGLAERDELDLLETLDMTYHDDKATLDGLDINQVRQEFWNWLESEDCKAEWDGLKVRPHDTSFAYTLEKMS
jgi:hypothetical protein